MSLATGPAFRLRMLLNEPALWPLLVLIALIPGAVRLWRDRALRRLIDDAAFPERLVARRKEHRLIVITCSVVLGALGGARAFWLLPPLVLINSAAGFPLRRRIYDEAWTLPAYLWFGVRLFVATFGFWILLALATASAGIANTAAWLVPALLGVLLLAWNERFADVLRFAIRAQPVTEPTLLARFQELALRAGVPMPRFEYVDMRGGFLANAVAVPSLRRPTVVFTDALLARLEPDEVIAICAHELAHLEYYDRRRLQRYAWVNRALIAGASFVLPSVPRIADETFDLASLFIPFAIAITLVWRAKDRQKNETVSDERAVALTGKGEALATGLTKLYTWARVPRRFDQQHEQSATHPSLARRIRDIRAATGAAPAPIPDVTTIVGSDGVTCVTFEPTRLRWTEGNRAEHALSYAALSELRVDAGTSGHAKLVAAAQGGHRWTMALADTDTPAVQSMLDRVDGQLAHRVAGPRLRPASIRLYALLAAALTLGTGQIAGALVAVLAFAQPSAAIIGASGAACLVSALLALRGPWANGGLTIVTVIVGIGLLAVAWFKRRDAACERTGKPVILLAAFSALFLLITVGAGLEPVRLYQSAHAMPAASALLVGLATALAIGPRPAIRLLAIPIGCVGLAVAALGSTFFLDAFGRDPFLVPAADVRWDTTARNEVARSLVPSYVSSLQLSPHGQSVIAWRLEDDENDDEVGPATAYVGRIGDTLSSMRADAIAFVDDTRVLAARFTATGADLVEQEITGSRRVLWKYQVARRVSGNLTFDAATQRWRFLGRDRDLSIVRVEGQLGTPDTTTTRWPVPAAARVGWMNAFAVAGDSLVTVMRTYEPGPLSRTAPRLAPLVFVPRSGAQLWRMTPADATPVSRTLLEASCSTGLEVSRLVCDAFDGNHTRLLAIDAASAAIEPIGSVAGRFVAYGSRPGNGWMTGWNGSNYAAIRIGSHQGVRLVSSAGTRIHAAAATDGWIAAVTTARSGTQVRLYRLQ